MRMTRRTAARLLLTSPLLVRAGVGQAAEPREYRVAIQYGLAYLPLMMIEADKLLEKEAQKRGVPEAVLRLVRVSGSASVNDALVSGNAEFGVLGIPALLALREKTRGGVLGIAGTSNFAMVLNVARPELRNLDDFKQTDRIALTATNGPQAVVLRMAAEKMFGNPKRFDANMVSLPHPEGMAALLSGTEVAGHFTNIPFSLFEAQDKRVRRILSSADVIGEPATFVTLVGTRKEIDADPRLGDCLVAAMEEAIRRIAAEPDRAAAVYLRNEASKIPADMIKEMLGDKENAFRVEPAGVMAYAKFLTRSGILKKPLDRWQDAYFPYLHSRPGS